MKIYKEGFGSYTPWSGAVETFNRIEREGKLDELEALIDDLYPDGISETGLNDLLWFEDEWLYECLGIRTEKDIENDIEAIEEQIDELQNEYADYIAEAETDEEAEEYKKELETELNELQEQLDELKEELDNI